ncbi:ectoine synthase [Streptomyces sp. NPDC048644]
MIVRSLDGITGTDRDVEGETWRSRRIVLAREGVAKNVMNTSRSSMP